MSGLLAAVLSLVGASAASAQSRIAFSSTRGGTESADIYVMNPDGSGQAPVTSDAASDVEPTWSPDGSRLALTRIGFGKQHVDVGHIFVINVDGSGLIELTKAPSPTPIRHGHRTGPRSRSPVAASTGRRTARSSS